MPTSPLKRPSTTTSGGRLGRLLASLRPPARAGPLPVQTGFPTSLADIVVQHHGRLSRNPRRQRHRTTAAPSSPAAASAAEPPPAAPVPHDPAAPLTVPTRHGKGAGDRPWLLALLLLVVWSKQLVAAATLASVALTWIESARTVRRPRRPDTTIREAAESPRARPSCCAEPDSGSSEEAAADADIGDLGFDGDSASSASASANENPKRKQSRRRSLRKLLASKLRNGKTTHRGTDSRHGEHEQPDTPRSSLNAEAAAAGDPAEETPPPAAAARVPEAISDDERCRRRPCGRALLLPALVPIILAGLVAGKLPALALAVLCATFFSSVERVQVPASGDPR